MFKCVVGNKLPDLKAGDVLFAHFRLSLATLWDYFFSAWFLPNVYLHVAFVIEDCTSQQQSHNPEIIYDAVSRRRNKAYRNNKVTRRPLESFLRNMTVIGIGRIEDLQITQANLTQLKTTLDQLCNTPTAYSMVNFKCPQSKPPSFSCYGLVEYCYELLGFDLVDDDKYLGQKKWCFIPLFRPEHQREAFKTNRYAFNDQSII